MLAEIDFLIPLFCNVTTSKANTRLAVLVAVLMVKTNTVTNVENYTSATVIGG